MTPFRAHRVEAPGNGRGDAAAPAACAFGWRVRVYYEDTDAAGIVYYANYLRFMERARTEWLRSLGFDQGETMRTHGIAFVVHGIDVNFRAPAALDDELAVTVEVRGIGASRIVLGQRVLRGDDVLVEAGVEVACVKIGAFKPVRIPGAIRSRLPAGSAPAPGVPVQ